MAVIRIYAQTIHRTTQISTEKLKLQLIWKSAGRAPSLRVLPLQTEQEVRKSPPQGSSIHITIHPHITKPIHTRAPTHYKTHTYTHTHTHTHTLQNNMKPPQ